MAEDNAPFDPNAPSPELREALEQLHNAPTVPPRKKIRVASITTHFNINRNIHEAHTGEVTREEQIKSLERHVRWHERQVAVGKELLAQVKREKEKDDAKA